MLTHKGTALLQTERLQLRRYTSADAESVYRNWASNPASSRFWTWSAHEDIEETRPLLAQWVDGYARPDCYNWCISLRVSGEAIGYLYFDDIDAQRGSAVLSYLVSPDWWNRGIATEAVRAALAFAFAEVGFQCITAHHHVANGASGRVLEKAGMRFEGETERVYPECERINGRYRTYAMDRDDWRRTRG